MTILLVAALLLAAGLQAQKKDPVLFTVDGKEVPLSEFVYIYEKTNGQNADYSRKSLEEYLELYKRFKLKVKRAHDMRLDTVPSLQQELEGYRRQLADSYLIDKEITEKLVAETYERVKLDVDISHILISTAPGAAPADTLAAYQKALAARQRLVKGEDWAKVAAEVSDDKSVERNQGRIGFVTALFPNGYYNLETAAYTLPVGQVSQPIRTDGGYHLVKVHERRPARGEIEAAHIMLRTKDRDPAQLKVRIDSIYRALQDGASFEQLAADLSQDGYTAEKGGYIGFFGINRYEKALEDAAFGIAADGSYSEPFQSSIGWHIIKRISKRDIQPYSVEKRRLESMVKKDSRHEAARRAMLDRIKSEGKFVEHREALRPLIDTLTDDFLTFRWKAPAKKSDQELFRLGSALRVTVGDFTDYLGQAAQERMRLGPGTPVEQAVNSLYDSFVDATLMKYEESRLEEKYPEFKYLMREYEEGILLFEATQNEVWNKASQDSAGLAVFYEKVKDKYRWDDRAQVTTYNLLATAADKMDELREFVKTHPADEALARFNTEDNLILSAEEKLIERTKNNLLIGVPFEVGTLSPVKENSRNKTLSFFKIEEILPSQPKTLDEARGYVIAEYQDYLEQQWVEQLNKKYEVKVNEKVFESLIKQ